jgi:two-component system sensor histidine kinase/response regulator
MAGCDVLVVDDDVDQVSLLLSYFSMKGLAARGLTHSQDYVKDVQAADPRVVLLDVTLPGVNGFDVCFKLKRARGTDHIKVIIVTAMPRGAVESKLASVRADGYLLKPFSLVELDNLVFDT